MLLEWYLSSLVTDQVFNHTLAADQIVLFLPRQPMAFPMCLVNHCWVDSFLLACLCKSSFSWSCTDHSASQGLECDGQICIFFIHEKRLGVLYYRCNETKKIVVVIPGSNCSGKPRLSRWCLIVSDNNLRYWISSFSVDISPFVEGSAAIANRCSAAIANKCIHLTWVSSLRLIG